MAMHISKSSRVSHSCLLGILYSSSRSEACPGNILPSSDLVCEEAAGTVPLHCFHCLLPHEVSFSFPSQPYFQPQNHYYALLFNMVEHHFFQIMSMVTCMGLMS